MYRLTLTRGHTRLSLSGRKQPGRRLCRRKGIGTLEVVIIIAVLLSVALIFRQALTAYATDLIGRVFNRESVIEDIAVE